MVRRRHRYNRRRRGQRGSRHRPRYSLFQRMTYFATKHPITVGVTLILASLILFRLSFTNTFLSSSEVFVWSIIISIFLFLGGLLTLIGWWRNNISMLTTKEKSSWEIWREKAKFRKDSLKEKEPGTRTAFVYWEKIIE